MRAAAGRRPHGSCRCDASPVMPRADDAVASLLAGPGRGEQQVSQRRARRSLPSGSRVAARAVCPGDVPKPIFT